jgi:hypothetical protein
MLLSFKIYEDLEIIRLLLAPLVALNILYINFLPFYFLDKSQAMKAPVKLRWLYFLSYIFYLLLNSWTGYISTFAIYIYTIVSTLKSDSSRFRRIVDSGFLGVSFTITSFYQFVYIKLGSIDELFFTAANIRSYEVNLKPYFHLMKFGERLVACSFDVLDISASASDSSYILRSAIFCYSLNFIGLMIWLISYMHINSIHKKSKYIEKAMIQK